MMVAARLMQLTTLLEVLPLKPIYTPALLHNTKGLPVRLGEVDCSFYLKTGSCKYGATCRYNHPNRYAINPSAAAAFVASPAAYLNIGLTSSASILQTGDPRLTQAAFYMKVECACLVKVVNIIVLLIDLHMLYRRPNLQNIKLTLAGLP